MQSPFFMSLAHVHYFGVHGVDVLARHNPKLCTAIGQEGRYQQDACQSLESAVTSTVLAV